MDDASPRGPARYPDGRFGPGHTGRPRGARNKVPRRIALGLLGHYEANEEEILARLMRGHFKDFMRLIGRMLPPEPDEGDFDHQTPEEAARTVRAVRAALERVEAGQATLAEVEAALMGEGAP